jgi:hypothetical protein
MSHLSDVSKKIAVPCVSSLLLFCSLYFPAAHLLQQTTKAEKTHILLIVFTHCSWPLYAASVGKMAG